ncbi:hypothetical protein AURDEDRAFT_167936 [Auricularia subglabra TFB-10046 SS5]|nr:hypothetical protein AURDEDRAFT_167936 [Auricularia subglabra TFB-10046 SS5]
MAPPSRLLPMCRRSRILARQLRLLPQSPCLAATKYLPIRWGLRAGFRKQVVANVRVAQSVLLATPGRRATGQGVSLEYPLVHSTMETGHSETFASFPDDWDGSVSSGPQLGIPRGVKRVPER